VVSAEAAASCAAAVVPVSAAVVELSDELDEHPARPIAITDAAANAKILFFMLNVLLLISVKMMCLCNTW